MLDVLQYMALRVDEELETILYHKERRMHNFTPAQKEAIASIQKDMRLFVFGSEEIAQRILNLSPEERSELRELLIRDKHAKNAQ